MGSSSMDVGVYRDARKTFPFFRCFERDLEDFAGFVGLFPCWKRAVCLSCFFFCFFFSGYQRACLFFSVLLSSAKMSFPSSLSGLLLCFEAMLDFLRYASMPHFAVL